MGGGFSGATRWPCRQTQLEVLQEQLVIFIGLRVARQAQVSATRPLDGGDLSQHRVACVPASVIEFNV